MEKIKKITKLVYKGEVDEAGLPHGKGELHYVVEKDPKEERMFDDLGDLRYKGEFLHGIRQGDGDLHALGLGYNPVSKYEWYSQGEYDSCGRLIYSGHKPGSYNEYVPIWYPYFEGTWQDDQPLKPRWDDAPVEESVKEEEWQYIRLTSKETLEKTFDFTFNPVNA